MAKKQAIWGMSLLIASTLAYGCGTKKVTTSEVPKEPVQEVAAAKPVVSDHYLVERNDTLWGIAGKSTIYEDSFQWPLIFKANRDAIKDPDLIFPKQEFMIQKGLSAEETSHARDLAMKTPKFVPHSKPRQTLPIDYF
jgi:hypothetical protein